MHLFCLTLFRSIFTFHLYREQRHLITRYLLLRVERSLQFLAYLLTRNRKALKELNFERSFTQKCVQSYL